MLEHVSSFITESNKVFADWQSTRDDIAKQYKRAKENQCSIAVLEANLEACENLQLLKLQVERDISNIENRVQEFNVKTNKLKDIKSACVDAIKVLLSMHHELQSCLVEERELFQQDSDNNDPLPVEAAKLFWSDVDNHQIRGDPPIAGVYKDAFRQASQLLIDSTDLKK